MRAYIKKVTERDNEEQVHADKQAGQVLSKVPGNNGDRTSSVLPVTREKRFTADTGPFSFRKW